MNNFKLLTGSILVAACTMLQTSGKAAAARRNLDSTLVTFVGSKGLDGVTSREASAGRNQPFFALSYMTAAEMKQKVRNITGFLHSDFDTFADVLGRWDPRSGTRTADRPSLVSFLFLKRIGANVASAVLKREVFLDPEERTVFRHTDFAVSPTDDELVNVISGLYENWLATPLDGETQQELNAEFRTRENESGQIAAYQWLVEILMQHGGLYYY